MNSSLIGKIEKARRYAAERDRIRVQELAVQFRGEHDTYHVRFRDGRWQCSCHFFPNWGVCSHTMALEKILGEMLPKETTAAESTAPSLTVPSGSA